MNYRNGPFALFALRNYIGKEKVNNALRQMLRDSKGTAPLPTTLDFYKALLTATPDSLQYLVHDLFEVNTFWELETEQANAKQLKAGYWQVTIKVVARKVAVNEAGVETVIPMNDWVEIGVSTTGKRGGALESLYLKKHRIKSGKQNITVTIPRCPAIAGIDPNHLLIDLDMDDNSRKVTVD
jgi:hypothetical protein